MMEEGESPPHVVWRSREDPWLDVPLWTCYYALTDHKLDFEDPLKGSIRGSLKDFRLLGFRVWGLGFRVYEVAEVVNTDAIFFISGLPYGFRV